MAERTFFADADATLDVQPCPYYTRLVIQSFRCRETEKIFNRIRSRKFVNIERMIYRRLQALDVADTLADLAGSGMSVESLKADRAGQYSIRINDQYRICFLWKPGEASEVEIVDYH